MSRDEIDDMLARMEGIPAAVLDRVDLDEACSPVIPMMGGDPAEAERIGPGQYRVTCKDYVRYVSEPNLRIMRARYLFSGRT